METKICGKCHIEKSISEFYKHKRDGYQSVCRDCHRIENREYNKTPKRKAYNAKIQKKLVEEGYFKDYLQRPGVKERKAREQRRYCQDPRLRIKYLARWYTKRMIRNGTIPKEPCAICGKPQAQVHHTDYGEPLLIVWLCRECHRALHNTRQRGSNETESS